METIVEKENFGAEIQWLTEIEEPPMDLSIARLKKANQTLFKSKEKS